MFPITHIWFSDKVLGYTNHLTVLGAIFPDACVCKYLSYDITHKSNWDIFDYIFEEEIELSDFAKAMVTHTVFPKGLDYYCDGLFMSSKGYCFKKAALIVDDVIDACNLPEEYGLWKAHNFIEMAVELEVATSNRWINRAFREALYDDCLVSSLESFIEFYFNLTPGSMKGSFKRFESFAAIKENSSYQLALQYELNMQKRHGININVEKSSNIIESCRDIIKEDFTDFINTTEDRVKRMLHDRLELNNI